jgi:hypothetical protein
LAIGVRHAEVKLGSGFTLLGGEPIPPDGLGIVLWHTLALVVPNAEVELGSGFTLLGGPNVRHHLLNLKNLDQVRESNPQMRLQIKRSLGCHSST